MKRKLSRFCIPAGLLLNSGCHILDHFIPLGNAVVLIVSVAAILLLFLGLFHSGRYIGRLTSIPQK